MSELAIKMTSDDQQVSAAVQRLDQGVKQVEKSFDSAAVASQRSADAAVRATTAQSKLAAEGKRIADSLLRQNEDLSESWERQKNAINEAHRDGKLSADQHQRALELLEKKISDTAAANRAKARAATEAAEAEKRAALESTEAYQLQQREIKEGIGLTQRMEDKAKSLTTRYVEFKTQVRSAWQAGKISAEQYKSTIEALNREFHEVRKTQDTAAGPSALAQVKQMAAGYISWSTAAAGVRSAIREVQAEMAKGRSSTETLKEARQNLLQVSQGDFTELEKRADLAAVKYGTSRTEARQVLFSARSEGFEKDYEAVMRMSPLIPAMSAARVAGQTNQLFGGKFTAEQIIGGVFKGAADSRLDFAPMAEQIPVASEGAAIAGASAEETIASLSVLASKFNNAGDRIKALASKIGIDDRTKGRGLLGGIKAIQQMSEAERRDFLGDDQEKNAAYLRFIETMPQIEALAGGISQEMARAGTADSMISQRLAEAERNPTQRAFRTAERLKVFNEITAEGKYSQSQSNIEALKAVNNIRYETGQQSGIGTWATNRVIDLASMGPGGLQKDAGQKLEAELAKQTALMEQQLQATRQQQNPNQVPVTRPNEDK
jgi:hypothetical protein